MLKELNRGRWSRPTDKSAVYLEIPPDEKWGIRVTLIEDYAKVEAVDGPQTAWYNAPERYCSVIRPPKFWERLKGVTLESKIMAAVQEKRKVAEEENARLRGAALSD